MIGRLYRPQRLRYIRRSANRRWALVHTRTRLAGWIPYLQPVPSMKDDQALIAAYRAGDDAAFARSTSATTRELERYARKILRRSSERRRGRRAGGDAAREPRAAPRRAPHRAAAVALPADAQHAHSTSSRACGPTRSTSTTPRTGGVLAAPESTEPEAVLERRGNVRDLLGDMATLPASSATRCCGARSTAVSHAALAVELGVSPQATKNLVHRARTNLVKQRAARSDDCDDVRRDLLEAHDEGRRASAATLPPPRLVRRVPEFRRGLRRHSEGGGDPDADAADGRRFGLLTGKAAAADRQGRDGQGRRAPPPRAWRSPRAPSASACRSSPPAIRRRSRPPAARCRPGLGGQGRRAAEGHRDRAADGVADRRRLDGRARLPVRAARGGPDRRPRRERVATRRGRSSASAAARASSSSRGRARRPAR